MIPFLLVLVVIVITGLGCKEKGDGEDIVDVIPSEPTTPTLPVPPDIAKRDVTEKKLHSLAEDFAAVWGTYSSESNCQNVQELLDYMTENFREKMQKYIRNQCDGKTGANFTLETEVLDSVILDNDGDQVDILVVTERWRDGDYVQNFYSNLILDLRVETNAQGTEEWRVDSVYWVE